MTDGPGKTSQDRSRSPALRTAVKYAVFIFYIFLTAAFQSSFFPTAGFFPAVPDVVLSAVLGFALFDGEKSGAAAGLAAGVISGALGADGAAVLPLFYFAVGYFCGVIAGTSLKKNLLSWSVYALAVSLARAMLSALYMVLTEDSPTLPAMFSGILLPEFAMTLIFSYFNYFLTGLLVRPFAGGSLRARKQNE